MRAGLLISLCLLALPAFTAARGELEPRPIAVEPGAVAPGQAITLRWYFTGTKVLLTGGRFGKGTVVTGKSQITDTPTKTTRYTFDVWYPAPVDKTKPAEKPIQIHQQYVAVAAVDNLVHFTAPEGFDLKCLKGWRRDHYAGDDGTSLYWLQRRRTAWSASPSQ